MVTVSLAAIIALAVICFFTGIVGMLVAVVIFEDIRRGPEFPEKEDWKEPHV